MNVRFLAVQFLLLMPKRRKKSVHDCFFNMHILFYFTVPFSVFM